MPSELARSSAHGTLFHVLLRLSVRSGTTPALPLVVECPHLSPLPWGPTYPYCVQVSEFSACHSHHEVWPKRRAVTALPGCWVPLANLFLHKYVFPGWVPRSGMTNPLQHSNPPKSLNPFLYLH